MPGTRAEQTFREMFTSPPFLELEQVLCFVAPDLTLELPDPRLTLRDLGQQSVALLAELGLAVLQHVAAQERVRYGAMQLGCRKFVRNGRRKCTADVEIRWAIIGSHVDILQAVGMGALTDVTRTRVLGVRQRIGSQHLESLVHAPLEL